MVTKKDYLHEKAMRFKQYIQDQCIEETDMNELNFFKNLSDEELLTFAINNLLPYKKNLNYCSLHIINKLKINNNKNTQMIIENYLELFVSLLE